MILFVFLGEQLLKIFGLDVSSFAVGGFDRDLHPGAGDGAGG